MTYATGDPVLDEKAHAVLVRCLQVGFMIAIATQGLALLLNLGGVAFDVSRVNSWWIIETGGIAILMWLLVRCLRTLSVYKRSSSSIYVSAFVLTLAVLVMDDVRSQIDKPQPPHWFALSLFQTLLYSVLFSFHLLMMPVFYGRDTRSWLRVLFVIALCMMGALALYASSGILRDLLSGSWRVAWRHLNLFSIGMFIGITVLLLLRREFNRMAVVIIAGWAALFIATIVLDPAKSLLTGDVRRALYHLLYLLWFSQLELGLLPLWLLVWFAFRFDKHERIELAGGQHFVAPGRAG